MEKDADDAVRSGFATLISGHGFTIAWSGAWNVVLRSPTCEITIGFERYRYVIEHITIAVPGDSSKYVFLYVMLLRCPGYTQQGRLEPEEHLSPCANLRMHCEQIQDLLLSYCTDLLGGDSSNLRNQGYVKLAEFIETRLVAVINLPMNHPVAAKFWAGDWSWVTDLRKQQEF